MGRKLPPSGLERRLVSDEVGVAFLNLATAEPSVRIFAGSQVEASAIDVLISPAQALVARKTGGARGHPAGWHGVPGLQAVIRYRA